METFSTVDERTKMLRDAINANIALASTMTIAAFDTLLNGNIVTSTAALDNVDNIVKFSEAAKNLTDTLIMLRDNHIGL